MKKYVLLGGAGYVAPKHYQAIKQTGGDLIAILDPHDSVGVLDSYFPDCKYFSEFTNFTAFCNNKNIDYTVVCSPNFYHSSHCAWALNQGMDVICEKPTVLSLSELHVLFGIQKMTKNSIYSILQLRLSSDIAKIAKHNSFATKGYLTYYTPRGPWYNSSWKGSTKKSGGLTTAIGIHLLDLLLLSFGPGYRVLDWQNGEEQCGGHIQIGKIEFEIDLSIARTNPPTRLLSIGDSTFDLSKGFTDLHIESYRQILDGNGIRLDELKSVITLCEELRQY
jgi:UDP-N-acetyl-2-amino-2-deoxyglucuronate dehydrogenase